MAESYERLNAAMEERRVQLRMSWRDITRAAEMSYEGLRAIRKGERHPTAVTKARLEDALQWQAGSIDTLLSGGEPIPLEIQPPHPPLLVLDRSQLRETARRLRQQADDLDRLSEALPD